MKELKADSVPIPPRSLGANVNSPSSTAGKALAKGAVFRARDRDSVVLFSAAASAQELRSLDVEKERREAAEEVFPRRALEEDPKLSDSETSSSWSGSEQAMPNASSQWKGFFRLWRQKSMRRLSTFPAVGVPKLSRWRTSREGKCAGAGNTMDVEFCGFKPSWKNFSMAELQDATNNFNPENIIGKGGYAEVFKGRLADGQLVAVKRLTRGTSEERTSNFLSELGMIVHTSHQNVAKLVGFGVEGGMHIVLQLSPHGSLASFLYIGSKEKLEWETRYKIALGTAEGLEYLHEKCQRRIIHRDIKAANILLADDFEPQICDFGLAKWLPDQWTHHTVSSFEGTFGYLAPEYSMHGIVDEKTDVYAFGVLLLELITGRQALDSSRQSLVIWARPLLDKNDTRGLLDPAVGDAFDNAQLNRAAFVASLCIQQSSILRPTMSQVLKLLKGEETGSEQAKLRQRMFQRTFSEELFDADEYNATKCLTDLSRHRQVALEF